MNHMSYAKGLSQPHTVLRLQIFLWKTARTKLSKNRVSGTFAATDSMHNISAKDILIAFLIALLIIGLIIMTADEAPQWIYQGF